MLLLFSIMKNHIGLQSGGNDDERDPRNVWQPGIWRRSDAAASAQRNLQALNRTIAQGRSLDPSVANVVANAMKDWAIEKGATHFTIGSSR